MAYVVGLMNGTSVDGCDAALVQINERGTSLLHFISLPTPPALKQKIFDTCSLDKSDIRLTCSVNVEIGYFFADAVKKLCKEANIRTQDLFCIGSHGQTVYHIPEQEGDFVPSTLQLGDPAIIAYQTGAPVVSSFRSMDMAAGGRGAPLVPYTEYLLYKSKDVSRALHNLGGIANVTVLQKNCTMDDVFAFDTGPANMIIDALMEHFFHVPYDENGDKASQGKVHNALLSHMLSHPYFKKAPPKATGREMFGKQYVHALLENFPDVSPLDFITTATMFTAQTMKDSYQNFVFPKVQIDEIVLSGGGSHNQTLINLLKDRLPNIKICTQEDLGYSSDAKEGIAFALLAHETMHHRFGNLKSATGASKSVILGNITPVPF